MPTELGDHKTGRECQQTLSLTAQFRSQDTSTTARVAMTTFRDCASPLCSSRLVCQQFVCSLIGLCDADFIGHALQRHSTLIHQPFQSRNQLTLNAVSTQWTSQAELFPHTSQLNHVLCQSCIQLVPCECVHWGQLPQQ